MTDWTHDNFFKPRWGFAWYPEYDKLGHFILHYFATHLTLMGFLSLEYDPVSAFGMKVLAVILWFAIGAGYEFVYEPARGRKPSWKDMVANLIGGVLGVTI